MCRPIRALTEARGHATSKHMYAVDFLIPRFREIDHSFSSSALQVSVEQVANMHAKSPVF
jgi:hypothetical protein